MQSRFARACALLIAFPLAACGAAPSSKAAYGGGYGGAAPSPMPGMPGQATASAESLADADMPRAGVQSASPQAPSARAPAMPGRTVPSAPQTSPAQHSPPVGNVAAKTTGTDAQKGIPDATAPSAFVIYTGDVSMLDDEEKIPALLDKVIALAEQMGGRIQARRDASVVVAIPSARFREGMSRLDTLGAVTHRSVSAQDVSEEFHDAEVRLTNLRATRKRLEEFLARAGNIQDTLTVERELERVAQEIDRLQGRIHYLSERAAMSQITVSVAAKPKAQVLVVKEPPPPPPPPPTPPRRAIDLPVKWLGELGAEGLRKLED